MHWHVITNSILLLQKKVFVIVPKYPFVPSYPPPFCVCFTVFYILNRQVDLQRGLSICVPIINLSSTIYVLQLYISVMNWLNIEVKYSVMFSPQDVTVV